jgi:parallel beta-helix repeat protein
MTHAADHNTIHATVGLSLPTNLTITSAGHLAHHNTIHGAADLGLPTNITQGATGHIAAHTAISGWMAQATAGIRGAYGQQLSTANVPGWPGSFTSSHSTFSSLQSAVNAAGTGRKFEITASMAFTATIAPHASDEFWFDPGVTITMSGGPLQAIAASGANNVKVMNGKFVGFNDAFINSTGSTGWEVAYCELDGNDVTTYGTNVVKWVHHNKVHRLRGDAWASYQLVDGIIEDNEYGPSMTSAIGGQGNKIVQTVRMKYRHNWIHDIGPTTTDVSDGIWLDFKNWDAIVEWNLVADCAGYGINLEANYQANDSFTNTLRYNTVRNSGLSGINLSGSSHTNIYQNVFSNNSLVSGSGETSMGINQGQIDSQGAELKENYVHHNQITTKNPTSLWAARLYIDATITDPTPYRDNTKHNNWDYNSYDVPSPTGNYWRWDTTNKTFAQWQALPQDVNGTAV